MQNNTQTPRCSGVIDKIKRAIKQRKNVIAPQPSKPQITEAERRKEEEMEIAIIANSTRTLEGFKHYQNHGTMPEFEWPDQGNAAEWGINLSQADGVTLIITPESHVDKSSAAASIDLFSKAIKEDSGLTNKAAMFLEVDNESLVEEMTAIDRVTSNVHIKHWREKNVRPSTPRASFETDSPKVMTTKERLMNMVSREHFIAHSDKSGFSDFPNVAIVGVEDHKVREHYIQCIDSPYHGMKALIETPCGIFSAPWTIEAGLRKRNRYMAKNIVKFCKETGRNFCNVTCGSAHENELDNMLLSKDVAKYMKEEGIPFNIVHMMTSRVRYNLIDSDFEFDSHNKFFSDKDKLRRQSFVRGSRETTGEILYIGRDPEADNENKSYNLMMRVIARQEAAKKPDERRVGASNEKTIAAAEYEKIYEATMYPKLCAQFRYLKKIEEAKIARGEPKDANPELAVYIKDMEKTINRFNSKTIRKNYGRIMMPKPEIVKAEIKDDKDYIKANTYLTVLQRGIDFEPHQRKILEAKIEKYDAKNIQEMMGISEPMAAQGR